jgi:hypothetical protein
MHHPITWSEVITVIIGLWLGWFTFKFVLWAIARFIVYRQDMKTEEPVDTHEPYAGKTLGL